MRVGFIVVVVFMVTTEFFVVVGYMVAVEFIVVVAFIDGKLIIVGSTYHSHRDICYNISCNK